MHNNIDEEQKSHQTNKRTKGITQEGVRQLPRRNLDLGDLTTR